MRLCPPARSRAAAEGHAMRLCPPARSCAAAEGHASSLWCAARPHRACSARRCHRYPATVTTRCPCSRRHDREKRFGCCEGVRMKQNLGFADAGHTLPSACACAGHTLPSACACAGHSAKSVAKCVCRAHSATLPSACACAGHTLTSVCECRSHSAKCAGHTLPSACACMHALLCYPASADPAYLTEPQHVCTDPHTRSVWCDTRAAAARGTSREVKMGTACA
jgi:hypothetical protein